MTAISALEAKVHFGELLGRVARGQEIVITRYDKPVARIVPEGTRSCRDGRAAADGLLALQKRIATRRHAKAGPSDTDVREAVEEGRP